MLFPLVAVVAQCATQRPGARESLGGELDGDLVECDEMVGRAAPEGDLGDEAGGTGQQPAHRFRFAFGELPVPVQGPSGLLDDADALGHDHQRGRHRDDAR